MVAQFCERGGVTLLTPVNAQTFVIQVAGCGIHHANVTKDGDCLAISNYGLAGEDALQAGTLASNAAAAKENIRITELPSD